MSVQLLQAADATATAAQHQAPARRDNRVFGEVLRDVIAGLKVRVILVSISWLDLPWRLHPPRPPLPHSPLAVTHPRVRMCTA